VDSLLNPDRPPVFCPGCSHDRSVHVLDRALQKLGLRGSDLVIVSDIGFLIPFSTPMHFTGCMVVLLPMQPGPSRISR